METTLQYLKRNYQESDDAYFNMQVQADDQAKIVSEAQRLENNYRSLQKEYKEQKEKYLKMIQELEPNFEG